MKIQTDSSLPSRVGQSSSGTGGIKQTHRALHNSKLDTGKEEAKMALIF